MLDQVLNSRFEFGRTFHTALRVLIGLAMIQGLAIGWSLLARPRQTLVVSSGGMQPSQQAVGVGGVPWAGGPRESEAFSRAGTLLPVLPAMEGGAVTTPLTPRTLPSDPGNGGLVGNGNLNTLPQHGFPGMRPEPWVAEPTVGGQGQPFSSAMEAAAAAEHPAHRFENAAAKRIMAVGLELRGRGDMQTALRSFRDALVLEPEHPQILSEIAATYGQMGLDERAEDAWKRVRTLGEEKGGAFYDLAGMALQERGEDSGAVAKVLRLGQVEVRPDSEIGKAERLTLRIPVAASLEDSPEAADMAMLVYFYDRVGGTDVAPTTADTAEQYLSAPYDWADGVEVIEVTYAQPEFTDIQKSELGERSYYGYIIELYYRDDLQEVLAEPLDLMAFRPGVVPSEGKREATLPAGQGAEGSLFPTPKQ